jgi:S-adenosyl-L-methionine hydrolase (adenosine-forming)
VNGIITMLTDFGTSDGYVGAMKGALLSIAPQAVIVDISHEVPPQDVRFAAFTLMTSIDTFPAGTVHVAVVDPGVGSSRRALAVRAGGTHFVGPDNGLLSWAVARLIGIAVDGDSLELGSEVLAVSLDVPGYWRSTVSSTFHGRDIFGPVAAHLSRGVSLGQMGAPVSRITALPFPTPAHSEQTISGEVLVVDRFGNCITNIRGDRVATDDRIEIAGQTINGLSVNYESDDRLLALIGSSGFLEIAVPGGSAAERLGVRAGEALMVPKVRPSS